MAKREAFLQAAFNGANKEFLHFIQLHVSKYEEEKSAWSGMKRFCSVTNFWFVLFLQKDAADPFDLNELLQELSRKQKEALWEKLAQWLAQVLVEDPTEEWQRVGEDSDDDMEIETAAKRVFLITDSCYVSWADTITVIICSFMWLPP